MGGHGRPPGWFTDYVIEPQVYESLPPEEASTCLTYLYEVAGTNSKGWTPKKTAEYSRQLLFEAVHAKVTAAIVAGTDGEKTADEVRMQTATINSAKRFTGVMIRSMLEADTATDKLATARVCFLVKNAGMRGGRYLHGITDSMLAHEEDHRHTVAAIEAHKLQQKLEKEAAISSIFEVVNDKGSHGVWTETEKQELIQALAAQIRAARLDLGVTANACEELGPEWTPNRVEEETATALLTGHIDDSAEPRWNEAGTKAILTNKAKLTHLFQRITGGIQAERAAVAQAQKEAAAKEAQEQAAAAVAKRKEAADREKAAKAHAAELAAIDEATREEEKAQQRAEKAAKLKTPASVAPLFLETALKYPWAQRHEDAPIWARFNTADFDALFAGKIFDQPTSVPLLFGTLKVIDATLQADDLDGSLRRELFSATDMDVADGAGKSKLEHAVESALRRRYGLRGAPEEEGQHSTERDIAANVRLEVETEASTYDTVASTAAESASTIMADKKMESTPAKRVAAFVAANGELAGHTTKRRWELAFYYADVLGRVASAEQIEMQLTDNDAMEWSMFIDQGGFKQTVVVKTKIRAHFAARTSPTPCVARLERFEDQAKILTAPTAELDMMLCGEGENRHEAAMEVWRRVEEELQEMPLPPRLEGLPDPSAQQSKDTRARCISAARAKHEDMTRRKQWALATYSRLMTVARECAHEQQTEEKAAHERERLTRAVNAQTAARAALKSSQAAGKGCLDLDYVVKVHAVLEAALDVHTKEKNEHSWQTARERFAKAVEAGRVTNGDGAPATVGPVLRVSAWLNAQKLADMKKCATGKLLATQLLQQVHTKPSTDREQAGRLAAAINGLMIREMELSSSEQATSRSKVVARHLQCTQNSAGAWVLPSAGLAAAKVRAHQAQLAHSMITDPAAFRAETARMWQEVKRHEEEAAAEAVASATTAVAMETKDADGASAETTPEHLTPTKSSMDEDTATPPNHTHSPGNEEKGDETEGGGSTALYPALEARVTAKEQHPDLAPLLEILQELQEMPLAAYLHQTLVPQADRLPPHQLIGKPDGLRQAPMLGIQLAIAHARGGRVLEQVDDSKEARNLLGDMSKSSITASLQLRGQDPDLEHVVYVWEDTILTAKPYLVVGNDALTGYERAAALESGRKFTKQQARWQIEIASQRGGFEPASDGLVKFTKALGIVKSTAQEMAARLGKGTDGTYAVKVYELRRTTRAPQDHGAGANAADEGDMDVAADIRKRGRQQVSPAKEISSSQSPSGKQHKASTTAARSAAARDPNWGDLHRAALNAAASALEDAINKQPGFSGSNPEACTARGDLLWAAPAETVLGMLACDTTDNEGIGETALEHAMYELQATGKGPPESDPHSQAQCMVLAKKLVSSLVSRHEWDSLGQRAKAAMTVAFEQKFAEWLEQAADGEPTARLAAQTVRLVDAAPSLLIDIWLLERLQEECQSTAFPTPKKLEAEIRRIYAAEKSAITAHATQALQEPQNAQRLELAVQISKDTTTLQVAARLGIGLDTRQLGALISTMCVSDVAAELHTELNKTDSDQHTYAKLLSAAMQDTLMHAEEHGVVAISGATRQVKWRRWWATLTDRTQTAASQGSRAERVARRQEK
eukprot:SAG31_NODE_6_length_43291_cov_191.503496_7_plen_1628_part_00